MVDFILSAFTDEASPMLDEQIMSSNKHKFSHIELRTIDGKNITELTDDELRVLSRKLEFDEIDVSAICSPIGRVSIDDDFAIQFEKFKRTVEVANILSTTRIRISSFFIPTTQDGSYNYENYHNKVIDQLGTLGEYSKKQGVFCFIENEHRSYADTSTRILSVHKELKDYVKFLFNPANTVLSGENCYDFYSNISSIIDYFYIKDALINGDIVPTGAGVCDIAKILAHYHKTYSDKLPTVLTLQPGLFIANDRLDYHYENSIVAFDVAMNALKSTLEKEGFFYI